MRILNRDLLPDYYGNKHESMRLVAQINDYWFKRGYPHFRAYLVEEIVEYSNGRRERVYNIRSNIKMKARDCA